MAREQRGLGSLGCTDPHLVSVCQLASQPVHSAPKPKHRSSCKIFRLGISEGLSLCLPPHFLPLPNPNPITLIKEEGEDYSSLFSHRTKIPEQFHPGLSQFWPEDLREEIPPPSTGHTHILSAFGPVCKHNLHARTCLQGLSIIGLPGSTPRHPLPPPHPPPSHPHCTSKEIRNMTTNSSCRRPTNPHQSRVPGVAEGVGAAASGSNW